MSLSIKNEVIARSSNYDDIGYFYKGKIYKVKNLTKKNSRFNPFNLKINQCKKLIKSKFKIIHYFIL